MNKLGKTYIGLITVALLTASPLTATNKTPTTKHYILITGTYTSGSSCGIYAHDLDCENLKVSPLDSIEVNNPSYLSVSNEERFIYAVSEADDIQSAANALTFDKKQGKLTKINSVSLKGGPCYIHLDPRNRFIATANYGNGTVSVATLKSDKSLQPESQTFQFRGKGPVSGRQDSPHLHCVTIAPDNQNLFATDLGTDRIYRFAIKDKASDGKWLGEPQAIKLTSGSGPRHLIFNQSGKHAYLINELSGKVTVFKHRKGKLTELQSITADTCNAGGSADIHLSPDERFLYVSTRLKGDGIVTFKVLPDGQLRKTSYTPTGSHPRNFVISPDGKLMLVACRDANAVEIYSIDTKSGKPEKTGKHIPFDKPVYVKLLKK